MRIKPKGNAQRRMLASETQAKFFTTCSGVAPGLSWGGHTLGTDVPKDVSAARLFCREDWAR